MIDILTIITYDVTSFITVPVTYNSPCKVSSNTDIIIENHSKCQSEDNELLNWAITDFNFTEIQLEGAIKCMFKFVNN